MRVSVIIPVFNGAGWIERCVESVRRQTWRDYEVIVIDDASTDGAWEMVRRYEGEGLRVLRNEVNIGPWGSRDRGLDVARGEIVIFLDSDDELVERCLERCVETFYFYAR